MLSIIIVNYKNESRTIKYVQEELKKVTIPHIVVVVNNASTTGSNTILCSTLNAELVQDISNPIKINNRTYVISSTENLGFAKGNNLGAKFSINNFDIEYFLFSNNDIRFLSNNLVEILLEKLQTQDNVSLIGPKVLGLDGKNQSPEPYVSFYDKYIWMYWSTPFLSLHRKIKRFKLDYAQNANEGIHYKIMGSFFLVKTNDFIKCGMMDENTFLFAEEVILTEKFAAIGKYTYYFPQVSILHEHSITISKHLSYKKKLTTQFASESYYYKKYKGVSSFSILLGKLSVFFYLKFNKIKKT
jgi:GT2 family glycosyltransferase